MSDYSSHQETAISALKAYGITGDNCHDTSRLADVLDALVLAYKPLEGGDSERGPFCLSDELSQAIQAVAFLLKGVAKKSPASVAAELEDCGSTPATTGDEKWGIPSGRHREDRSRPSKSTAPYDRGLRGHKGHHKEDSTGHGSDCGEKGMEYESGERGGGERNDGANTTGTQDVEGDSTKSASCGDSGGGRA